MTEDDEDEDKVLIRESLTPDERAKDAYLAIDPGFVHYGLIEALLGPKGMAVIDEQIRRLPDLPDQQRDVRVGHIYTKTLVTWCNVNKVQPLNVLLSEGRGRIFCSVETVDPCPDVYTEERVTSTISSPGFDDLTVELEYSTARIASSTTKMELANGDQVAIIAQLHATSGNRLRFRPLVIGGPWLYSDDATFPEEQSMWWSYDFFEHFVEDIDEFSRVEGAQTPDDFSIMQQISESAFKQCLAEILGDDTRKDWGGETSDHFSSHLHVREKPMSAAFLLKGPARFAPMGLNHLGKNNDQIFRLSQEPAQLLVVQHCHEILPPVRATLRAFVVMPGNSRRYCLIDGRDSLRLLIAYDKVDRALELSAL